MQPQKKRWLVILFIHEIWELKVYTDPLIDAIEAKGCGANTAFFLLRDSVRISGSVQNFELTVSELREKDGKFKFDPVELDFDNSDRHCWEVGLQYAFAAVEAERNMMITISHGAAFGINGNSGQVQRHSKWQDDPPHTEGDEKMVIYDNPYFFLDKQEQVELNSFLTANKEIAVSKDLLAQIDQGRISKISDHKDLSCRKLEILWTADLANALDRLPRKCRIDIMLMCNCYMQSFETGYILRNNVHYLIAPETAMPVSGYKFLKLLDHLAKPELTTERLAATIVDDYTSKYPPVSKDNYCVVLSANRLAVYEEALDVFERLLRLINSKWAYYSKQLVKIREDQVLYVSIAQGSSSYNRLMMIDMCLWGRLALEMVAAEPDAPQLANDFRTVLDKLIVARHTGGFFTDHDANPNPPFFKKV